MRRKICSEPHRSPMRWLILLRRRGLAFLLTGVVLATLSLGNARAGAAEATGERSCDPLCATGAEKFRAPALEEETPLPTKGALVLEGSLILYVCEFMSLSRITFFPIHE